MELSVIQNKIYEIRNVKVMLDFDLAEMYGIETKVLKQSVKRNIKRFYGEDFMFELTNNECNNLITNIRSQIVTLKNEDIRGKYPKYAPFAFTELGVAMLSSVLNSDTAIEINRNIMRAFVVIRQLVLNAPVNETKELKNEVNALKAYIEEVFEDYNDINEDTRTQLELINEALAELQSKNKFLANPRRPIGYRAIRDRNTEKQ